MSRTRKSFEKWSINDSAKKRTNLLIDAVHQGRIKSSLKEIEKIKNELGIVIDNKLYNIITNAYYNNLSIDKGEIYNVLKFVKEVYISLTGSDDGLTEFLKDNSKLISSNYAMVKYRTAIFSHFGYLKEVFFENTDLLTSSFTLISTKDFYRFLSLNNVSNIEDFRNLAIKIHPDELKRIRESFEVDRDLLTLLNSEMLESLKSIKKKNTFLYSMRKRKNS